MGVRSQRGRGRRRMELGVMSGLPAALVSRRTVRIHWPGGLSGPRAKARSSRRIPKIPATRKVKLELSVDTNTGDVRQVRVVSDASVFLDVVIKSSATMAICAQATSRRGTEYHSRSGFWGVGQFEISGASD